MCGALTGEEIIARTAAVHYVLSYVTTLWTDRQAGGGIVRLSTSAR
jgi:hypothetical protein